MLVVVEQALELRPRGRSGANHRDPGWDEERAARVRTEGHFDTISLRKCHT